MKFVRDFFVRVSAMAACVFFYLPACAQNSAGKEISEGATARASSSAEASPEETPHTSAEAQKEILRASDFGAVPNDNKCDSAAIQAALNALSKKRNAVLVFAPGTYDIASAPSGGGRALLLEGAADVEVDCGGALFMQHDNSKGFLTLDKCRNVSVKNLSLDFAEQPYALGTVESTDIAGRSFIVEVNEGYHSFDSPALRVGDGGFFLDAKCPGAILRGTDAVRVEKIVPLGGNGYEIFVSATRGGESLPYVKSGDLFVLNCRRSAAALGGAENENCRLENITIYASGAGAFTFSKCDGLKFLSCSAKIKPGRFKSINADGFHLPHCRNVELENCSIYGASDDCLNMYLTPRFIRAAEGGRTLELCRVSNGKAQPISEDRFEAGDSLAFFCAKSGEIFALAKVEHFDAAASRVRLDREVKGLRPGLDKQKDITVYNLSDSRGLKVKNCSFGNSSRFGLYIKASDVSVQGCLFENLGSSAITMHNEPGWPEGLCSRRVSIERCRFVSNGRLGAYERSWPGGDVSSLAIGVRFGGAREVLRRQSVPLADSAEAYFNSDLNISSCEFSNWLGSAVYLRSVENVKIEKCTFSAPRQSPAGAKISESLIRADFCKNIVLEGNTNNSQCAELREKKL